MTAARTGDAYHIHTQRLDALGISGLGLYPLRLFLIFRVFHTTCISLYFFSFLHPYPFSTSHLAAYTHSGLFPLVSRESTGTRNAKVEGSPNVPVIDSRRIPSPILHPSPA